MTINDEVAMQYEGELSPTKTKKHIIGAYFILEVFFHVLWETKFETGHGGHDNRSWY